MNMNKDHWDEQFLCSHLSLYTEPEQKHWDEHEPACLMVYRTAVHEVKMSLYLFMFGREPRM